MAFVRVQGKVSHGKGTVHGSSASCFVIVILFFLKRILFFFFLKENFVFLKDNDEKMF